MEIEDSKVFSQRDKGGADQSINLQELVIPRSQVNTFEGCEYLDDNLRMEERSSSDMEE